MRVILVCILICLFVVGAIIIIKHPAVVSWFVASEKETPQTNRVATTGRKMNHRPGIPSNGQELSPNKHQNEKIHYSPLEQKIKADESVMNRQTGSQGQPGWDIDWEKETKAAEQLGESTKRVKAQRDYIASIIEGWKSKDQMTLKRLIGEQPKRAQQCEEDAAQIAEVLADSVLMADIDGFNAEFWISVSAAIASARGKSLADTKLLLVWGKLCNSGVAAASSKNLPMAFHKLRQVLSLSQKFILTDSSGTTDDSLLGLSLERLSYAYNIFGDNTQADALRKEAERILGRQCVWPPESIALTSQ